jgi:isopenicillin N synthase-like dioxygenase
LPVEEKKLVKRNASNSRGYFNDEFTKQKADWKEGIDIGAQGILYTHTQLFSTF